MNTRQITAVLLPGIDGTAKMFGPLQDALAPALPSQCIAYPPREFLDYAALTEYVLARLPDGPVVLIAESFSGPLSLMVATRLGERCKAVVLVATFVTNPRKWESRLVNRLMRSWMLSLKPSQFMARFFVMGDAPDEMVRYVLDNHKQVAGKVTLGRLRAVFKVDVRELLVNCQIPVLHLFAQRDRVVLQHSVREIQHLRPDIKSICIDGPHFLLQTRAASCAREIVNFLQQQHILNQAAAPPAE